jgi:tRNA dimethylallyltransferase
MVKQGLLSEVGALFSFRSLPALRTVGYTELFDYLTGAIPLEQAIDLIKTNTRHYAKRQLTWFKKDKAITWYNPSEIEKIVAFAADIA